MVRGPAQQQATASVQECGFSWGGGGGAAGAREPSDMQHDQQARLSALRMGQQAHNHMLGTHLQHTMCPPPSQHHRWWYCPRHSLLQVLPRVAPDLPFPP
jgi:hypothetical protein